METSIYAYVLRKLEESLLTYKQVAEGSGVPKRTIEKIARKEIIDPGVSHIEKIAEFFQSREDA